jgi:hypothetical protein
MGWNWDKLGRPYPRPKNNGCATAIGGFILRSMSIVLCVAGILLAISGVGFLLGFGALCAYHMLFSTFGVVL